MEEMVEETIKRAASSLIGPNSPAGRDDRCTTNAKMVVMRVEGMTVVVVMTVVHPTY